MTYSEYYNEIKGLLQAQYPQVDFDNDAGINNKLNDLVWIVCHRINSPDPVVEKRVEVAEEPEGWRR